MQLSRFPILRRSLHTSLPVRMDRKAELKSNIEAIRDDIKKASEGRKEVGDEHFSVSV